MTLKLLKMKMEILLSVNKKGGNNIEYTDMWIWQYWKTHRKRIL